MKLKVKDLITPPIYVLPTLTSTSRGPQVERVFCDERLRALLRRVLDNLTPGSGTQSPATVLVGEVHSGKTSALRLVRGLLRDPAGQLARRVFPQPDELAVPDRLWLVIDLTGRDSQGGDPEGLLKQLLIETASGHGVTILGAEAQDLRQVLLSLPEEAAVVVTIDDFDTVLARQDEAAQRLSSLIAQLSQPPGLPKLSWLLAMCLESVPVEGGEANAGHTRLGQLLRNSDLIHTDCTSLVNAVFERLIPKTAYQQREAGWLLRYLKGRLPHLDCEEHEFARCYPLHPHALHIAQQLWRHLPQFNLSDFILDCVRLAYHRPALSIFTLDDLCGLLEAALRKIPQLQGTFEAYHQVIRRAVDRLNPEWRLWGRMLARALALHTAAGLPATSRELTEGCLIYDLNAACGLRPADSGSSPSAISNPQSVSYNQDSYHLTAMLLDQMQRLAPEHIQSDAASEPRYTLTQHRYRSSGERLLAESKALSDAASQLFSLLFACGETYFQNWPMKFYHGSADYHLVGTETEWCVEESPGTVCLSGEFASGDPLRVVALGWSAQGRAASVCATDFVWRVAQPTPNELKTLKALAVLREWQRSNSPDSRSPQFARLVADHRWRADQIFARLFLFDGHLSHNARPVSIDCEPPLSLMALLRRQADPQRHPGVEEECERERGGEVETNGDLLSRPLAPWPPLSLPPSPPRPANSVVDQVAETADGEALWRQPLRYALGEERLIGPGQESFAELLSRWNDEWTALDLSAAVSLLQRAGAESGLIQELLRSKAKLDELAAATRESLRQPEGAPGSLRLAEELFDHSPLAFKAALTHGLKLQAFSDWLPQLASLRAYLGEARVSPGHALYPLWHDLHAAGQRTLEFLSPHKGTALSSAFEEYRRAYGHGYLALHQQLSSDHIGARLDRLRSSLEWVHLEQLSQIPLVGDEHFAAARQVASELEALRCDLDPRPALLYQPRCHCRFAASDAHRLESLSGRAMSLLRQGLAYGRRQLLPSVYHLLEGGELESEVRAELLRFSRGGPLPEISEKTMAALHQAVTEMSPLSAGQPVAL